MKKLLSVLVIAASAYAANTWQFTTKEQRGEFHTGLNGLPNNVPFKRSRNTETESSFEAHKRFSIPNYFDLSKKVSPIKNQGKCGSCWAFATTAAERDAWYLLGKDPGELSEQYLVDCDKKSLGCKGGYFDAFNMLVHPKGSPSSKTYPYVASNHTCKTSPKAVSEITSWSYVAKSNTGFPSTVDVQEALMNYGPLAVAMYASGTFQKYAGGIFNACENLRPNHMVNIVGFNNEGTVANSNGMYPNGKGYWIARNSWGTNFGEKGFFKIKYTDNMGKLCNSFASVAAYVEIE